MRKLVKIDHMKGNTMFGRKNILLGIFLAVPLQVLAQDYAWNDCLQLTASDHTEIVGFIINNADELIPLAKSVEIPIDDPVALFSPGSASKLLLGARERFDAPDSLSEALALVAYCITSPEGYAQPSPTGTIVFDIRAILASADHIDHLISKFQNLQTSMDPSAQEFEAVKVALAILIDGKDSVYREADPLDFHQKVAEELAKSDDETQHKTAAEIALELAIADVKGALSGSLGGCAAGLLAGGAGCAAGALAGGVSVAVGTSSITVLDFVLKYF